MKRVCIILAVVFALVGHSFGQVKTTPALMNATSNSKTSDLEAALGQPTVSKELPSSIHLEGIEVGGQTKAWSAHGMFVPPQNYNYGVYYSIDQSGNVTWLHRYNDWYYSAAEYTVDPVWANAQDESHPAVTGYANDYRVGWSMIDYEGGVAGSIDPISLNMNDMTYDYPRHRMLGTKNGRIYEIMEINGRKGAVDMNNPLYDYADTEWDNIDNPVPVAIACDLNGDLYFVSLSDGQTDSKLYKLEWDNTNGEVDDITEIGSVNWPARKIQTMAFDHNTGRLYWWQVKEANSNFANFVEILRDPTTGEITTNIEVKNTNGALNTSIAGLFFEFDYAPHTATCIDDEEVLKIVDGTSLLRFKDFYPGELVTVRVTADVPCNTFDSIQVLAKKSSTSTTYDTVLYTRRASVTGDFQTVGGKKQTTFAMPAFDVFIQGYWTGNIHTITVNKTVNPNSAAGELPTPFLTTVPANEAECGDSVKVSYIHPEGWVLRQIVPTPSSVAFTNAVNYQVGFKMPDANVILNAQYYKVTISDLDTICQHNKYTAAPTYTAVTGYTADTHIKIVVGKMNGQSAPTSTTEYTKAQFKNKKWTEAGTYQYWAKYHSTKWGDFTTQKKTFVVLPMPETVGITAENLYCCVEGDINLMATDTTLQGTFEWYFKKSATQDTLIGTTTTPKFTYYGASGIGLDISDAGYYFMEYSDPLNHCTLSCSNAPVAINVSTLPNTPEIKEVGNDGNDSICYNTAAQLYWNHGVLNPEEYTYRWYVWDGNDYVLDDTQTDWVYTTDSLTTASYYMLIINYAGQNHACASHPGFYTVYVGTQDTITTTGDNRFCAGYVPDNLPTIDDTYTNINWFWGDDNQMLNDHSNVLHLGMTGIHPTVDIIKEVGSHFIHVEATSTNNCDIQGNFYIYIDSLPDLEVYYTNRQNVVDTARPDQTFVIDACYGDVVELKAVNADWYQWGQVSNSQTPSQYFIDDSQTGESTIQIQVSGNEEWQVKGYYYTTGCYNTVSIQINMHALPQVAWVNPDPANNPTEISMLEEEIQLEATPAGGIFTYIVAGIPDLSYPIDNGILKPAEMNRQNWALYDDDNCIDGWWLDDPISTWAVMFPAGTYEGRFISKVALFDNQWSVGSAATITVYNDGDDAPADPVAQTSYTYQGRHQMVEIPLANPVAIDNHKNVWIVVEAQNNGYPVSTCEFTGDDNSRWIYYGGTWYTWPYNYSFMIRALFTASESADATGDYQLIYSYTDPTTNCTAEERVNVTVTKPYWTDKGKRDENWFTDCQNAGRFEITNPAQMGAFAAYLNYNSLDTTDQNGIFEYDFAGDTLYITNDINLMELPYFYRPLNEFAGVLDGTGKVVDSMVIMENNLVMNFNGTIRNLGIHDAKIKNINSHTVINVPGTLHNSFMTNPELVNVEFNFEPTGDVQNFYFYDEDGDGNMIASKYINQGVVAAVANTDNYAWGIAPTDYSDYAISQNIYLNAQIGLAEPTVIGAIQLHTANYSSATRHWTIYLSNTNLDGYIAYEQYIPMTDAEKVFEGEVTFPGAPTWMVIPLDNAFAYDGHSNLVVTIYDDTQERHQNTYVQYYGTYTSNAQTIQFYRNDDSYDPSNYDSWVNSSWTTAYYMVPDIRFGNSMSIDVTPAELLSATQGLLEEWVWLKNEFVYRTWIEDAPEVDDQANYGYPIMDTSFEHHHYLTVLDNEHCDYEFTEGVSQRTLNNYTYSFADHGQEIELTIEPENRYYLIDSIVAKAKNYITMGNDIDINVARTGNVFSFDMPADSVYHHPYYVEIEIFGKKDYWTNDGNYHPTWFTNCQATGQFEIHSNYELAAFARAIEDGYNFDTITVKIESADTLLTNSRLINMVDHLWKPQYDFDGIFDGRGFIIDSLVIMEDQSAMFIDMDPSSLVRNLGIQDIVIPDGSYVFDVDQNTVVGQIHNSFVSKSLTDQSVYAIAPDEIGNYAQVLNCYSIVDGSMYDFSGNGTNKTFLNNWVIAMQQADPLTTQYMDWIDDDEVINYHYPIHSGEVYMPGIPIGYVPDALAPDHGYVTGVTEAYANETVTVETYPAMGYNLTQLWVVFHRSGNTTASNDSITPSIIDTKTFQMLPETAGVDSVTVHAVFTPIEWLLTIRYQYADHTTAAPNYSANYHYGDTIDVTSPLIDGYTADSLVVYGTMPNHHHMVLVTYNANYYQISLDSTDQWTMDVVQGLATIPAGDSAQYNTTATVVLTPEYGWSINEVWAWDACHQNWILTNKVPNTVATFEFLMPACDVKIRVTDAAQMFWTDFGIRDISWYVGNENADTFYLATDSMLGGLAALVSGMCDEPSEGVYPAIDFAGKLIVVESTQGDTIDLIEHKWKPIGAQINYNIQFNGTFDGNGTPIVNMRTMDMNYYTNTLGEGSCQAFFGNIGSQGVVNDLNIQGVAEGRYFTAGIAGVNYGTIVNCVANVTVRSEFEAGGIVANNMASGKILNSYCVAPEVECFSAAASKGTNNYYVGGIAAYNAGRIENCHTVTKLVKGNGYNPINYYGAIVGFAEMNGTAPMGTVSYCYYKFVNANNCTYATACSNYDYDAQANALHIKKINNSNGQTIANELSAHANTMTAPVALFDWTKAAAFYPVFNGLVNGDQFMTVTEDNANITVYPNPVKDLVKIVSDENIKSVSVFNMFGQLVIDREVSGNEVELHMDSYAAGVYMVRITTDNNVTVKNIVVE